MTTIRVCFTTLPSLGNHSRSLLRIGQQQTANFHQITIKNGFLKPLPCFFTPNQRFLKKSVSTGGESTEIRTNVYQGLLSSQIRTVKWFSLSTSLVGIIAQPFLYRELSALENLPMLIVGCSFVGLYTFVTPFLLHFVTKKYVTKLDYNLVKDTYIASTTNFFGMQKELEFKTEDVSVPDIPGMFTSFHVKGKALFLEARLFEDPGHYARIMGYDKPMDFKLYETSEDSCKVKSVKK